MKFGDSGDNISSLQKALTRVGYTVVVDGQFGAHTEAAVKALQEKNGLVVDGDVGHKTLVVIDRLEAALPKPGTPTSATPSPTPSGLVKGVDVSNWQRASDWAQIKAAGYLFGFIKTTEGLGLKNAYFKQDFANAKANGVYRGGYHFFHPNSDARAQANHFLTELGGVFPSDLPPVLDLEQMNGVKPALVIDAALVWLRRVREMTKKTPIIYTDLDILNQLGHPTVFKEFPLWLAEDKSKIAHVPKPWEKLTFWQDVKHPHVPGVSGEADVNLFFGTLAQLDAFAKATV